MKQKHKPFYKLTAICLSLSMTAASFMMNNVFAVEDAVFPETDYLTGQPLLEELRELGLGQDYENIEELPVPEEQIPPEEGEGTGSEVTDPEVTDPEVTDPEVTDPEVTDPEVTDPEVTDPEVTDPEVTDPEVTDPEVTDPEVTDPEVTDPEVTDPEVTDPEVTDPEVTDPEITDPETAEPIENTSLLGVFHLPLQIFYAEGGEEQLTDTHEPAEDPVLSTDETTGSTDETTGSTDGTTGSTDETTGSTDGTTGSTDETTGSTDETTGSSDESTESSDSEPVIDPGFGVDPVDPGFGVDPNQPVEEIPEESVPEATLPSREVLVAYVQELDVEQIVSLNDTNITYNEYVSFYSIISEQQIKQLFDYYYPTVEMTDPAPLNVSVNYQAAMRAFAKYIEPKDDGLYLEKSVTPKAGSENQYTVQLEAFSTGTVITETSSVPIDVVLVLDQSGSMQYSFDDEKNVSYEQSRQYAMQNSVKKFIESVCTASDPQNSNTIGIVSFDSEGHKLTEGLQKCNEHPSSYFTNIIDNLGSTPSGATNVGAGMQLAEQMVPSETEGRKSVVIVFTDGVPTTHNTFSTTVANTALSSSKKIKDKGADVYTIGIFGGADESKTHGDVYRYLSGIIWEPIREYPCNGSVGSFWGVSDGIQLFYRGDVIEYDVGAGNRFLNYLSSNFMNATEIGIRFDDRGHPNDGIWVDRGPGYYIEQNAERHNTGYYMTAGDQSGLDTIFENISNTIVSPSANLDEETRIVDTLSDYFEFVGTNPSDVRITTKAMTYSNGSFIEGNDKGCPEGVSASIDDGQVTVTGFDFNYYFVSTTDEASEDPRKLIIEFDITTVDGFIGGNQVPTNGEAYVERDEEEDIPYFKKDFLEHPIVDVPINDVTIRATDKNVYLMGDLTAEQLKEGATVTIQDANGNSISVNPNNPYAGMEPWQHEFVNITITAPTEGMTDLTADKDYTLSAKVTPKEKGKAVEQEASATARIKVFKPEITWRDSAINAGEKPNYEDGTKANCNFVSEVWKHGDILSTNAGVVMIGDKPELDYSYGPEATAFTKETPVNVTVSIGETDVTQYVTFYHVPCDFDGCTSTFDPKKCEFIVHIKTFDLKITKNVEGMYVAGETFRFTVTGPGNFETSFTLGGESDSTNTWSVTLKGLDVGTYTITEDTGWSWRYTASDSLQQVTADNIQDGKAEVTFTNRDRTNQWLSWEGTVENNFDPVP